MTTSSSGGTYLSSSTISMFPRPGSILTIVLSSPSTVFVVGACILNIFCVRYLPLVDRAALFWSLAGVTTISITVLACRSDGGYQDAGFVFGRYINESGCMFRFLRSIAYERSLLTGLSYL